MGNIQHTFRSERPPGTRILSIKQSEYRIASRSQTSSLVEFTAGDRTFAIISEANLWYHRFKGAELCRVSGVINLPVTLRACAVLNLYPKLDKITMKLHIGGFGVMRDDALFICWKRVLAPASLDRYRPNVTVDKVRGWGSAAVERINCTHCRMSCGQHKLMALLSFCHLKLRHPHIQNNETYHSNWACVLYLFRTDLYAMHKHLISFLFDLNAS